MSKMITVRMPDDRVARIDSLVDGGSHPTRASFVIAAIDRLVADLEEQEIDRAIVDGYTRVPPTPEEDAWAEASGRRSIADERW